MEKGHSGELPQGGEERKNRNGRRRRGGRRHFVLPSEKTSDKPALLLSGVGDILQSEEERGREEEGRHSN